MGTQTDATPALITTASVYSLGPAFSAPIAAPAIGASAWTGASAALYAPISLPFNYTVQRVYVCNGGTVSGNFDFGIYSDSFVLLNHTGSTAQAGTNTNQYVALNQTLAGSTRYYLALVFDNGVGQILRASVVNTIYIRPQGLLTQAAAFPLPATATPAVFSSNYLPVFGITRTTTGF